MIRKDRARRWSNPKVAPSVYFRWATPADADKEYLGWLNEPEVRLWLSFPSHRVADLRTYIRSQVNKRNAVAFFIIHMRSAHDPARGADPRIGTLKLVKEKNGTATLGLMLGRARGHGYGVEAINLACQFARDCWGIKQVECGIHSDNVRSIRAFEKAGFTIRPKTVWGTRVS
jgi:RimJ/RimL family protein N-acetyltransferase